MRLFDAYAIRDKNISSLNFELPVTWIRFNGTLSARKGILHVTRFLNRHKYFWLKVCSEKYWGGRRTYMSIWLVLNWSDDLAGLSNLSSIFFGATFVSYIGTFKCQYSWQICYSFFRLNQPNSKQREKTNISMINCFYLLSHDRTTRYIFSFVSLHCYGVLSHRLSGKISRQISVMWVQALPPTRSHANKILHRLLSLSHMTI